MEAAHPSKRPRHDAYPDTHSEDIYPRITIGLEAAVDWPDLNDNSNLTAFSSTDGLDESEASWSQHPFDVENDTWMTYQVLSSIQAPEDPAAQHTLDRQVAPLTIQGSKKRAYDFEAQDDSHPSADDASIILPNLEHLNPTIPNRGNRRIDLTMINPFDIEEGPRHAKFRPIINITSKGGVSGYIKFRLCPSSKKDTSTLLYNTGHKPVIGHSQRDGELSAINQHKIAAVPSGFGAGGDLDQLDFNLMRFYSVAFCNGRSLLPNTNFWYKEFRPMAEDNEGVRHAILAVAAGYLLDFLPDPKLLFRANFHYKSAADLLGKALRNPRNFEVGKGDDVLTALVLLLSEDVINFELRKPKEVDPRWRAGGRIAMSILEQTDPGYRYWKLEHVQTSKARIALANRVAYVEILAQITTPLRDEDTDRKYGWLLHGDNDNIQEIQGGTGLSPKLLHIFAQITALCYMHSQDPESNVYPQAIRKIERRLASLKQWSDSPGGRDGYTSVESLLASCEPDEHGKAQNVARLVDIIGHSWISAAHVYIQCRFHRKPRAHADVASHLADIRALVMRMPFRGPLFNSQAPFFVIFLLGLVFHNKEDGEMAREWFETICSEAGSRSSVPPVWEALKKIRQGIEEDPPDDEPFDEQVPIGDRKAWWEILVERIVADHGQLSLC